jgi:hypothetical protein
MPPKTDSVPTLNCRAEKRRQCASPVPVTVYVYPGFPPYAAYVKDLSAGGVGLYLSGPAFVRGARLLVRLPGRLPGTAHTALAEVVHRTPLDGGRALVGCKFLCRLIPGHVHEQFRLDD